MMLRMRKWRAGLLAATLARRGALVLDYRCGRRRAHLWRAAYGSSAWIVQLTGNGRRVLTAHRWQEARRLARCHVFRGRGMTRRRLRDRLAAACTASGCEQRPPCSPW